MLPILFLVGCILVLIAGSILVHHNNQKKVNDTITKVQNTSVTNIIEQFKRVQIDIFIIILLSILFSWDSNSLALTHKVFINGIWVVPHHFWIYELLSPVVQTTMLKLYQVSIGWFFVHAVRKVMFPKVIWSAKINETTIGSLLVIVLYAVVIYSMAVGG